MVVILAGCMVVFFLTQTKEPTYQGRTLTEWAEMLHVSIVMHSGNGLTAEIAPSVTPSPEQPGDWVSLADRFPGYWIGDGHAVAAIRAIGTNALPRLLEMLNTSHSKPREKLIGWINGQSIVKVKIRTAIKVRRAAENAFMCLGSIGSAAIPQLIELTKNRDPGVRISAQLSLVNMGTPEQILVPLLTRMLDDSDEKVQTEAHICLSEFLDYQIQKTGDIYHVTKRQRSSHSMIGTNSANLKM